MVAAFMLSATMETQATFKSRGPRPTMAQCNKSYSDGTQKCFQQYSNSDTNTYQSGDAFNNCMKGVASDFNVCRDRANPPATTAAKPTPKPRIVNPSLLEGDTNLGTPLPSATGTPVGGGTRGGGAPQLR